MRICSRRHKTDHDPCHRAGQTERRLIDEITGKVHLQLLRLTKSGNRSDPAQIPAQAGDPDGRTAAARFRRHQKGAAFAIAWGTLFALIFGGGLSLSLEQSGTLLLAGIALGLPGLFGLLLTYPLYVRLERRGREKIAERILAISDELLHETKRN